MRADVVVIGGGPAGLSTAIAASLKGLRVTVVDARKPPIDKACGEGLLPHGSESLRRLGVELNSSLVFPFTGLQFSDEHSSVCARFPSGRAFGIRRTVLHRLLVERALELGVSFAWGTRVLELSSQGVETTAGFLRCAWLVGADGGRSRVAQFAGIGPRMHKHYRFGFRRHYEIAPWSDLVEVRWEDRCQIIVTPTKATEICVSVFTSDPKLRVASALARFPDIAQRLGDARPLSDEAGAVTLLAPAGRVTRGNVALVGDASCMVDGIAGQGLSLAFGQALELAEALASGDLSRYESAHRRLIRTPLRITRLLLAMSASSALRGRALRLFERKPEMFADMISMHARKSAAGELGTGDLLNLGWRVLWA